MDFIAGRYTGTGRIQHFTIFLLRNHTPDEVQVIIYTITEKLFMCFLKHIFLLQRGLGLQQQPPVKPEAAQLFVFLQSFSN